jgi:cytochrome b561
MTLRNTPDSWGSVQKTFHWIVAALVVFMLCLGLYMTGVKLSPRMFGLFALHKSIGITVLALIVLRLLWTLASRRPDPLPSHRRWEKLLANLIHGFLYAAVIFMPLSGWVMSSAKNFHVSVFGLFTLPDIVAPDPALAKRAVHFHDTLAWCLIAAVGLHIAGALKHHVVDRDSTLRRMLPFAKAFAETEG